MAKRVFEIAKSLGVASKAIVAKCHAEGIPEDVIKNHMSSVSAGLEATIRDWFTEESSGTAVETAEKVDIAKARKPARRAARAAGSDDDGGDGSTQTAVAEAEAPAETDRRARPAAPAEPEGEGDETETPARPEPRRTAPPAQAATAPAQPTPTRTTTSAEDEPETSAAPRPTPVAPAAKAPESGTDDPQTTADAASTAQSDKSDSGAGVRMNVPQRPTIVSPAGPQLSKREPVKLSGPKVVRVEAPDPVDAPRPRRSSGPRFGPGDEPAFTPGAGGGGDDRAGRGNKRRSTGSGVPARRRGRADGTERPAPGTNTGWTEQDLAEREARLQRSGGYLKQRRQQMRRQSGGQQERPATAAQTGGRVTVQAPFTIKDLSAATGVKGAEIVKQLFMQGIAATINSGIDVEKAQEIMLEYNIELEVVEAKSAEQVVHESFEKREAVDERPRGPVVTILGHVDHGKTSLLDRIRNAKVAQGEAGGITQATSAFRVPVKVGNEDKIVVFLDTPGHQAFTSMRARGANMTDIVVLVVAADDGVMPQTAESISHAKAAGVPIVVALNKIDKPEATDSNIQKILGQLAEHELNPVEWGGETEVVRTSAIEGKGIDDLLEILDYQAQLLELKADFGGPARGTVIESRPEEGRGNVANILVQDGRLKLGDFIVAGRAFGRVRDITDDRGQRLKEASPPMPVQVSGIDELPDAGDRFYIVDTLRKAEQAAEQRRYTEREKHLAQPKVTLDSLFGQMAENELKEILVVLKADVQGSIDVLRNEIEKISGDEVKVRVIHAAVGGVTESDVLLADASRAVIVGFNVIPSAKARQLADQKGVEIRSYQVIYDVTDDIKKAAEGLLEPELRQEVLGHAEVRQVFRISKVGAIAGCYITDGVVQRDALIRVTRGDIVVENGRRLEQLKRFKEDAREVRAGMECGMKIVGYDDIKEGDILECYKQVEVKRTL